VQLAAAGILASDDSSTIGYQWFTDALTNQATINLVAGDPANAAPTFTCLPGGAGNIYHVAVLAGEIDSAGNFHTPEPICGAKGGFTTQSADYQVATVTCDSSCPATMTQCSADFCAETTSDPLNCGYCDIVCPVPANGVAVCRASVCTVICNGVVDPSDWVPNATGTACVDINNDVNNCGRVGAVCPNSVTGATRACVAGVCRDS
jgi:hypothetical protein